MTTTVKTTEEFSSRRKLRYGAPGEFSKTPTYSLSPSSVSASLSPHKYYYGRDQDGNDAYFIEFNIGDFNFDEISIRTEGHRLIVQGKSKQLADTDEFSREFKRDFTLPNNVDQFSIKAQLDEATRLLQLIGHITKPEAVTAAGAEKKLASSWQTNVKPGTTKETRIGNSLVEYEIYIGKELAEGKVSLEVSGYSNLIVKVVRTEVDKFGDINLELKRHLKLPYGADSHNIEHGIDSESGTLFVKIPIANR